jgi:hypothetical protein
LLVGWLLLHNSKQDGIQNGGAAMKMAENYCQQQLGDECKQVPFLKELTQLKPTVK